MWINGVSTHLLPAGDRSAQFGDGSFTTAHISKGKVKLLSAHLDRLKVATERLMITGVDWSLLEAEMLHAASLCDEAVLKVVVTRGAGGRGYSPQGCDSPTRIISTSAYPAHYHAWREQGVKLALSPVALSQNPLLAGIKHLNRLEQVMVRLHLDQTDAQEALVVDTAGMLVECCAANLFWRKGENVFTPDLSLSGVSGVMRNHIIALLEQSGRFSVSVVAEPPQTLSDADEVIICNALMPFMPVRQVEDWHFTSSTLNDFLHQVC
ncbi:aminodeoxychorismate lyase [Ewingella americana]|uniref:aminodeoxychorismate lyase n=1 Tax=Ewingella americana TaxID=41202 RepID=UPI00163ADBDA|nr:aminodeoxychorismate lyase [Ewingella americana]QMV51248.1 aminodeoxychorismate lyase [Ewingella americana]